MSIWRIALGVILGLFLFMFLRFIIAGILFLFYLLLASFASLFAFTKEV